MKRAIIIAASAILLASTIWSGAQMFAQMFGATGTPIKAAGWWKLDGNALDSSGNGYDGVWGGTEAYTDGPFAGTQAAAFYGASVITAAGCTNVLEAITFCAWARAESTQQGNIVGRYNTTLNERIYSLHFNNAAKTVRLLMSDTGIANADYIVDGTVDYAGAGWIHYAATWSDAGKIRLYIDGVLSGTSSGDLPSLYPAPTPLTFGRFGNATFNLVGGVSDVRIFDRALSEDNIKRIMESQDNEPLEELQ